VGIFVTMMLLAVVCGPASGQSDGFGLGIITGEPTGISFKFWTSGNSAIDGAAAWSLSDENSLHLHADYMIHEFSLIDVEKGQLPVHYGIGGRIKVRDDDDKDDVIGIRFPVGLTYLFEEAPFDLFLEVVPVMDVAPDTELDFNAALGGRYWF
jgi:hypothetical protein